MFRTSTGEEIFIIDAHTHLWDASPANQRNQYGRGWIDCFYDYHRNLSPAEYVWPLSDFEHYSPERMAQDEFVKGYVDMAILQPTYLTEFFIHGFNTIEQNSVMKQRYPERFILNGAWDARDGEAGLEYLRRQKDEWDIKGVKLYTAEWRGASKGYKLSSPEAYRYLEECAKLGISNIHVHKGPTIYPLNRDAFDVADVDDAASHFPELNFIVEHVGLPRLEDFCWIAVQEKNVYAGLAVALPFIYPRPRYFAEIMANLLFWVGPDKILFGSDYAIWEPRWLVERFMAFELPQDLKDEFKVDLTLDVKRKIMGLNAARLYGIDPEEQLQKLRNDELAQQAASVEGMSRPQAGEAGSSARAETGA
ncbi:MAG: amidohydrolase [Thermogemmatispora sp.]|uniref:amidohydrolase family protein n=1 Tax=Thermogemmatispora sp. TaxID=1968838 RepID=UPI002619D221|nr:amidohydrolase family protein [Thermogemmatispora sp.]MBX5455786.1 amidohydrolase [Thermogemmatispora sp.]